jgi:hypothetical protein
MLERCLRHRYFQIAEAMRKYQKATAAAKSARLALIGEVACAEFFGEAIASVEAIQAADAALATAKINELKALVELDPTGLIQAFAAYSYSEGRR